MSLSPVTLPLDKLVVAGPAAELARECLLQEPEKIQRVVIHSLTGQFLETSNGGDVQCQTHRTQRATARPARNRRVVSALDVDQQAGGGRGEGGGEQRGNRRAPRAEGVGGGGGGGGG